MITEYTVRMLCSRLKQFGAPRAVFLHRHTKDVVTRALDHPGYDEMLHGDKHVLVGVYDSTVEAASLHDDLRTTVQELVT